MTRADDFATVREAMRRPVLASDEEFSALARIEADEYGERAAPEWSQPSTGADFEAVTAAPIPAATVRAIESDLEAIGELHSTPAERCVCWPAPGLFGNGRRIPVTYQIVSFTAATDEDATEKLNALAPGGYHLHTIQRDGDRYTAVFERDRHT